MRPVFISSFADEMNSYLEDKKAAGYRGERAGGTGPGSLQRPLRGSGIPLRGHQGKVREGHGADCSEGHP